MSRRTRYPEPSLAEVFRGVRDELTYRDPAPRSREPDWGERAPEWVAERVAKREQYAVEQDAVRRLAGRCRGCGHPEVDHIEVWSVDTRTEAAALGADRSTPSVLLCTTHRCGCAKAVES